MLFALNFFLYRMCLDYYSILEYRFKLFKLLNSEINYIIYNQTFSEIRMVPKIGALIAKLLVDNKSLATILLIFFI